MALPTFTPGTQIRAQEMNDALSTLFNMMYPVGSIYMSASLSTADAVNAALPGTWQAWGSGKVPVGVDPNDSDFNAPNKTGGAKTVSLTIDQMPAHDHKVFGGWGAGPTDYLSFRVDSNSPATPWARTGSAGGGQAHNNLQPYITCYMYKRVS